MGKSIWNALKKGVFLSMTMLSLTGCPNKCNSVDPTPNYAPKAIFSSSQSSIKIGGNVSLDLDGTDENGKEDIVQYEIGDDRNSNGEIDSGEELVVQTSPITNYSWTPSSTGTFKLIGRCTDAEGLTGKKSLDVVVSESDKPSVTLSDVDLIDGRNLEISLPTPIDDDTPVVPYTNAEVLTGSLSVDISKLNEKKLILKANPVNQNVPYQVRLTFGSSLGGVNTAILKGTIKNLCDISGFLQDNETHTNQSGTITLSDGTSTSTSGAFNIQTSSPVSEIKLKGQFGDSYVRTLTFDGTKDYPGIYVRAVPNPTFCSKENFKRFIRKINENYEGLRRWNLDNLAGIEILSINSLTGSSFSDEQIGIIQSKIKSPTEVEVFVRGKELDSLIKGGNHYTIVGSEIIPEEGWIIIVPDSSINGGFTMPWYLNGNNSTGIINRARIKINPTYVLQDNPTTSHEFGHAFIAQNGHANNNFSSYTIMPENIFLISPGVADKKAGQIIYEETYSPRENLDNILGMN
jgi:hypothetical protein